MDSEFHNSVKKLINNIDHKPEKEELLGVISQIPENTVWKKYFSDSNVERLEKDHSKIKEYRNDVMHSHLMTYEKYEDAMALYKTVNQELHDSIVQRTEEKHNNFNFSGLYAALENFASLADSFVDTIKPNVDLTALITLVDAIQELQMGCYLNSSAVEKSEENQNA